MGKFTGNNIKKQRELFQLNRFKDCFPEIFNSEVDILENDPPDGLIKIGNKVISIELIQMFWDEDNDGMNKKTQESIADMIMDLAQEKYSMIQGLPYVQVNVSFTDKYGLEKDEEQLNLNSGDKMDLPDYIVQKVVEYIPSLEKELIEVPEYDENWQRLLHPKIQSIYITRHPMLNENSWSSSGGGVIPPISFGKIQMLITKKDKILSNYRKFYNESWLVIVEDSSGVSGYFDFKDQTELFVHKFESDFNRIFILRNSKMEVLELKLKKRISEGPSDEV